MMAQTAQLQTVTEECIASDQGWRFLRQLSTSERAEYILSSEKNTEETRLVIAELISSLSARMSVAFLATDSEKGETFARKVMLLEGKYWSDSRLLPRSNGMNFISIPPVGTVEAENDLLTILDEAADYPGARLRILAYRTEALPETRFADLMAREPDTDLELVYSHRDGQPMLRISFCAETMKRTEVWRRMRKGWLEATQE